jgi:hypothetical protein
MKYEVKIGFYEYRVETMLVSVEDDLPVKHQKTQAKNQAIDLAKVIFNHPEQFEIESVNHAN